MSLTIQSGGSVTIQGGSGGGGGGATVGTFASRPAAGNAGALYIATDSPIAQWVDDGSAWRPLIQGQALGTQVPAASAFTAFNAGSGFSFSDNKGTISFSCTSGAGVDNFRGAAVSLVSPTAYVEGTLEDTSAPANATQASVNCIALRESATNKALGVTWMSWSASTSAVPSASSIAIAVVDTSSRMTSQTYRQVQSVGANFVRIYRSGANIVVATSRDAQSWRTAYTVATSAVFTSAPDQAAFGVMDYNVSSGNILSFKYGSL